MKILNGVSRLKDATQALDEATRHWDRSSEAIQFIILFHSTSQDARALAAEIKRRYPKVPSIGCTTAGEYLNGKHMNDSLVISAVASPEVRWAVAPVTDLAKLTQDEARQAAQGLAGRLGLSLDNLAPSRHFCIGFLDGMSMREEYAAAILAEAFGGIPFLGGSAGDDLKFKNTFVLANGESYTNAAVVALAESTIPFHVMKHQHFLRSNVDLVVTKVDAASRTVKNLDGFPAAQRYADVLGLDVGDLTPDVFSKHPLVFSCHNEIYVRSIQKVEPDGSLKFYCAVEEGTVLELADHRPMEQSLSDDISQVRRTLKMADWFIGCNCILRSLEATQNEYHERLEFIIANQLAKNSIGFDTYGEQLNGLHINQTLVGIAFGEAA